MSSYQLQLENITKDYGNVAALKGISLNVEQGEFITLLGPSGCGKTTTLRIIAGLEDPTSGRVILEGNDVSHLEPNKRDVNTVFQNYALFPHMTVEENIGYSQSLRKVEKGEKLRRVNEVLSMVQLEGYNNRAPHELSGGQMQRVAIARAVINRPKVLLLDEPLGALDLQLRRQLQGELKDIQRQLGITFVYITHDQDEALNLSDRIVVMREGLFEQIGTPEEIYNQPKNAYVAKFVGSANIIEGKIIKKEGTRVTFANDNGRGVVDLREDQQLSGDFIRMAIRGEYLDVVPMSDEESPCAQGVVIEKIFAGGSLHITVKLTNGEKLVSYHHEFDCPVEVGDQVCATWDPAMAVAIDLEG